ncbi:hypothetical protein BTHI11S_00187 [Bosea thiooxidans]
MASDNNNERPAPDGVLVDIADYVLNYRVDKTRWPMRRRATA